MSNFFDYLKILKYWLSVGKPNRPIITFKDKWGHMKWTYNKHHSDLYAMKVEIEHMYI